MFNSSFIFVWVLKRQSQISAALCFLASQKVLASTWKETSKLKRESDDLSDKGEDSNNHTDISDLVSNSLKLLLEKSWLSWFLSLFCDNTSNGVWSNSQN